MKVGILSMQRIVNYGSFLQSYGLMKIVEGLGHEVEFVDFQIEKPILNTSKEKRNYIRELTRNKIIEFISSKPKIINLMPNDKKEIFENIWKYKNDFLPLIRVGNEYNLNPKVDVLIVGSDEVFNLFQKSARVGYSLELYGKNNNANKLISYAASFGNTTIEKIIDSGKLEEVSENLQRFDSISVRDNNSGNNIKKLTNIEPNYNFDPVLMYDFSQEIP